MIIDNVDLPSVSITPNETNAPLVVDANAMLPGAVASKNFEPVAGRDPQVIKAASRVDCHQLGPSPLLDLSGQAADGITSEDSRGAFTGKALDHGLT